MAQNTLPREAIRALTEAAGLSLTEEQFADLIEAYQAYAPVLNRLPRDPPFSAEPAHVFDPRRFMPDGGSNR